VSTWLEKYRDFEVEVHYLSDNNMFKDRGRLADYGEGWIELDKSGAETFLIPTTAIRLVKVLHPPAQIENRLLRPAARPESESAYHPPAHLDEPEQIERRR